MKNKNAIETMLGGLIFFAVVTLIVAGIASIIVEPSVRDQDTYPLEIYYVHEGDNAWKIYKETFPEANWTIWSEYVAEINDDIKIGDLKPGDTLYIPTKK